MVLLYNFQIHHKFFLQDNHLFYYNLVFVINFFNLPSSTRSNSTKSVSSKSVINFLVNVKCIFNLSAPGAAKLVNPFALSYNDYHLLLQQINSVQHLQSNSV